MTNLSAKLIEIDQKLKNRKDRVVITVIGVWLLKVWFDWSFLTFIMLSFELLAMPLFLFISVISTKLYYDNFVNNKLDSKYYPHLDKLNTIESLLRSFAVAVQRKSLNLAIPITNSIIWRIRTWLLLPIEKDSKLLSFENCVYSQFGEDGITETIFNCIGHGKKYYIEFGVENGMECNTRILREKYNWFGLLMDGGNTNKTIGLYKEFITKENIGNLFRKYVTVSKTEIDFLCVDLDGNDWYILAEILKLNYKPRVICCEVNPSLGLKEVTIKYNPIHCWDATNYFGASITSFNNLLKMYGYTFIYLTSESINSYWVK